MASNDAIIAQQRNNNSRRRRPTMEALHQLIHQRKWDLVQHSIQLDASVAMRIDDSIQEDLWVDEARRLWIFDRQNNNNNNETTTTMAEEESNHLLFLEAHMKIKNAKQLERIMVIHSLQCSCGIG